VIKLTMAEEKSAELQIIDEYFTLGEPDDEDERRRDLLTIPKNSRSNLPSSA